MSKPDEGRDISEVTKSYSKDVQAVRRSPVSESSFRSLVQNARDLIALVDADGNVLYLSRSFETTLGYDPQENLGKSVFAYIHSDDASVATSAFSDVVERRATDRIVEFRLRHTDGSWRHIEAVSTNLISDPEVGGVVINARDVTGRKEAENRLRRAEKRYRTLVERVPAIVYIQESRASHSSPYIVTYLSPQVEQVLGYPPERFVRDSGLWDRLIYPEDLGGVMAEDKVTDETGDPFSIEYRMVARDGEIVWVHDEAVLIRNQEGSPLYRQGVITDMTDRKRAEEALAESEERFRGAFEDAPTGAALIGLDNRYLRVNRALCEMLGYSGEEMLRKSSFEITYSEDVRKSKDRTRRMVGEDDSSSSDLEKRYVRKDGSVLWAISDVSLVRDAQGRPSHFISHFQDLTARKQAEEALRESEELHRRRVACRYSTRARWSVLSTWRVWAG